MDQVWDKHSSHVQFQLNETSQRATAPQTNPTGLETISGALAMSQPSGLLIHEPAKFPFPFTHPAGLEGGLSKAQHW